MQTHDRVNDRQPAAGPGLIAWLLVLPLLVAGVHLVVGYSLVEVHCRQGLLTGTVVGLPALVVWLVAVTLVSFVALAASSALTLVRWRRSRRDAPNADPLGAESLLTIALLMDGLAFTYLVWSVLPIATAEFCA